jgi:hypothetical protein
MASVRSTLRDSDLRQRSTTRLMSPIDRTYSSNRGHPDPVRIVEAIHGKPLVRMVVEVESHAGRGAHAVGPSAGSCLSRSSAS